MILTTNPAALPGSCYLCGNGSRESYIDTGRQVDFHGAMYLCNLCVAEMAQLLGFHTPDQVAQLKQELEDARVEAYVASARAAGLGKAVDGLRDAGLCSDPALHLLAGAGMDAPQPREGSEGDGGSRARHPSDREASVGDRAGTAAESLHDEDLGVLRTDERSDGDAGEFDLGI